MPKHCHDELKRRWKMLHGSINYNEAIEAHESLSLWLSKINLAAKESLPKESPHKTGKETLTLIALGASEQLRVSLSSTNAIESCYSMVRRMTKNVKNWNRGTDPISLRYLTLTRLPSMIISLWYTLVIDIFLLQRSSGSS